MCSDQCEITKSLILKLERQNQVLEATNLRLIEENAQLRQHIVDQQATEK